MQDNIKIGYPYLEVKGVKFSTRIHFHKIRKDYVGTLLYLMVFDTKDPQVALEIQKEELQWNYDLKVVNKLSACHLR